MNVFELSWLLFKNNFRLYRFYLSVLVLTAAIFYNFLAVNYNPYLQVLSDQYVYARTASYLCAVILILTTLSFMFHANNFFYKLRYKEIGTYILMGIPENKIGAVFALESVFTGAAAVLIGLPLGLLFSKLFFMLLSRAMILDTQIPFYIPPRAIIELIAVFAVIIFLMGLKNYGTVRRSKLLDILNAAKKEQRIPKMRRFRGILGIVCIAFAYYLILNILTLPSLWPLDFIQTSVTALILICVGTYLFFGSFLSIALGALIRKKKVIYKRTRLISFSNTLFRLGTNYRSLSMTAVLCAATFAAFSGSLALKYYADTNTAIEAPYSISFLGQDAATRQKIDELISASSHQVLAQHESHFLISQATINSGTGGDQSNACLITSFSELESSLAITRPKDYARILKDIKPSDSETVCILHAGLVFSGVNRTGQDIAIQGGQYTLKKEVRLPFAGELGSIGWYDTYVVSDSQYARLKAAGNQETAMYGINISDPQDSLSLVRKIAGVMKNPGDTLNSYAGEYQYKYYVIGAFYFMGLVMSIVFIISTFSTMYFKILSDAVLDREQYKILMQIGMTEQEISGSIRTQIGIAFILPVLMGIAHGFVAMKALESFIHYQFTGSALTGIAVLLLLMTGFYFLMSQRYRNMVVRGWEDHETA